MESFPRTKTVILKMSVPLLVSAMGLYFAGRSVQWRDLGSILLEVRPLPLLLAVLIAPLALWLRGLRWRTLLAPFEEVPTFRLVRWQIGGLLINNILPLRMGEWTRAYWTGHRTGVPKSTVLATIVMERLLDLASVGIIAVLALTALRSGRRVPSPGTVFQLAILLVPTSALLLFLSRRSFKQHGLVRWTALLPDTLRMGFDHFVSALAILKNKEELAKLLLLSPLIWGVDIAALSIVSRSLDLDLSWTQAAVVMTGTVLGVMIPAAPGAAGTYEAGGVAALVLLGVDKTRALSFILLQHGLSFLLNALLGVPILLAEGFSPAKALAQAKKL